MFVTAPRFPGQQPTRVCIAQLLDGVGQSSVAHRNEPSSTTTTIQIIQKIDRRWRRRRAAVASATQAPAVLRFPHRAAGVAGAGPVRFSRTGPGAAVRRAWRAAAPAARPRGRRAASLSQRGATGGGTQFPCIPAVHARLQAWYPPSKRPCSITPFPERTSVWIVLAQAGTCPQPRAACATCSCPHDSTKARPRTAMTVPQVRGLIGEIAVAHSQGRPLLLRLLKDREDRRRIGTSGAPIPA